MKQFLCNTRKSFNIWKLAWFKAFLVAFITGFTTLQTTLNGLDWSAMSPTQQFLTIGGAFVAMATSIVAFLDRTMERISKELPPEPGNGNTDFLRQQKENG